MWNIFEQPWTLLAAGGVLVIVAAIIQTFKSNRLLWLIPLTVAVLGPVMDYAVRTDREKITRVIAVSVEAAENEDADVIVGFLAEDYRDSVHKNKDAIVRQFRNLLDSPLVEKIYDSILEMEISGDTASVSLLNRILIDPRSSYAQLVKIVLVKVEIDLKKTNNGEWLITRTEIEAINNQPATWDSVNYSSW